MGFKRYLKQQRKTITEMNILIVNPPRFKGVSVTRERRCEELISAQVVPPTTLLTVASILRNRGHRICFLDANAFNNSFRDISFLITMEKFDCVVFAFNHRILSHDLYVCNIAKKARRKCVTVGYSWFARDFAAAILESYPFLDVLMVDDPFSLIDDLVECLSSGKSLGQVKGIVYRDVDQKVRMNPRVEKERMLKDAPMPAYDLLPTLKPYHLFNRFFSPLALVLSSRGCPYGCRICNVAGTKYDCREPLQVVEELQLLQKTAKVKFVWFYDEVFTLNRRRIEELCTRMLREHIKIKWFCDTRVDLVDRNLLKLMHKSGCIGISYGVESGSKRIQDWMNKQTTPQQSSNAIAMTRREHIPAQVNILFCPDQEDAQTIKETKVLIKKILPDKLQIGLVDLHPGSAFASEKFSDDRGSKSYSWKSELAADYPFPKSAVDRLNAEAKATKRMLMYSPRWWINSAFCLLWNRSLVLPVIGGYLPLER